MYSNSKIEDAQGTFIVACLLWRGPRHAELPQAVEQVHPAHETGTAGVSSREDVEGAGAQRLAGEQIHGKRHFGASPLFAENGESSGSGEENGGELLGVRLVSFVANQRRRSMYCRRATGTEKAPHSEVRRSRRSQRKNLVQSGALFLGALSFLVLLVLQHTMASRGRAAKRQGEEIRRVIF